MADDQPEHQDGAQDPSSTDRPTDAGHAAEQALNQAQSAADELDEATRADEPAEPADAAASSEGSGAVEGVAAGAEAGESGEGEPPNLDLPNFQRVMEDVGASGIDLLRDVELNVKIELGRTHMLVEDVLGLSEGSVVELNKLAGDPVDVYVNDRLVARGEVLVLSENFCVRINEIVADIAEEVGGADGTTATEEAGVAPAGQGASAEPGGGAEAGGSEESAG